MQPKNKAGKKLTGVAGLLLVIFLMWSAGAWLFGGAGRRAGADAGGPSAAAAMDPAYYPVLVMMDNLPEARSWQSGLTEALVVYETLAEGGSTRLEALFAGPPTAERIGPVRSARPYFVQIAAGWGAFYWHAGGSPEGLALLKELVRAGELKNLNEISGLGPIYLWRDKSLAAPHNLFTSGEKIAKALVDFELTTLPVAKLTWQWEKDRKDKDVKKQAERAQGPAGEIAITFSPGLTFNPSYVYDTESKIYKRSLAGKSHKDYNTGEQLAPANVIVQKVPAEWLLPSGYDRIEINIVGEGEALFFRDGQVFAGRWKKADRAAQTEWLLDGEPFILKHGQTWVEIVPGERAVTYQ